MTDEGVERTQLLVSMTAWEGQIVAAKRRLNELTLIGRLPSEMLAEVFMHRSAGWHTGDRTWIQVSHICHRWRETALNCPALWGQIYTHTPEWTRELLLRSKQAALDVVIPDEDYIDEEVISLVLGQLHRMRFIDWSRFYPLEDSSYPRVAPLLRSVALCSDEVDERELSATPFDKIEAPPLTYLEIAYIPVSWTSSLFQPTLTHLTFRLHPESPRLADCNMSEVLGLLRTMPCLQSLGLANVLPEFDGASIGADVHACFSQLRLLDLEAPASTMRYFLEHVSFFKNADISIEFSDFELDHENMEQCMRLLASRIVSDNCSKDPIRPLQSLLYSRNAAKAWTIDQGVDALSRYHCIIPAMLLQGVRPTLSVRATNLSPSRSEAFFEMLCLSLPLAEVSSAFIFIEGMGDTQWRSAYESMPHLRELGVAGPSSCHTPLIESLATVLAAANDAPRSPHSNLPVYMFPKLEVLLIRGLQLPTLDADGLNPRRPHHLDAYAKVLRDRSDAGHQLSRLALTDGTGVFQQDVDKLRDVVKEVHCDRVLLEVPLEYTVSSHLLKIEPARLCGLRLEAGLAHKDLPSLTFDDKVRLFVVRPISRH